MDYYIETETKTYAFVQTDDRILLEEPTIVDTDLIKDVLSLGFLPFLCLG